MGKKKRIEPFKKIYAKMEDWRTLINLPDECLECKVLRQCLDTSDGVHVFCSELGKPYQNFNTGFQRIIKRSGIQDFKGCMT